MQSKVFSHYLLIVGGLLVLFSVFFSSSWFTARVEVINTTNVFTQTTGWVGLVGDAHCPNPPTGKFEECFVKSEVMGGGTMWRGLPIVLSALLILLTLVVLLRLHMPHRFPHPREMAAVLGGLSLLTLASGVNLAARLTDAVKTGEIIITGYAFSLFVAGTLLNGAGAASLWRSALPVEDPVQPGSGELNV